MILKHSNALSEEMRKSSSFLATNRWADFHQDLLRLLILMQKQFSVLTKDFEKVRQNQNRQESTDAGKIHNASTMEPNLCLPQPLLFDPFPFTLFQFFLLGHRRFPYYLLRTVPGNIP